MLYVAAGLKSLMVLSLALTLLFLFSLQYYGCTCLNDDISSLVHESFTISAICTISSQAQFWKDVAEKDDGQETDNPNILAARIQIRGGPITHEDINSVLARQGIAITAEELLRLKSIPYVTHKLDILALIKALYPSSSSI